ncbi:hypothetical protein [Gellertiella hungarica]|uniref:Inovirus Gp2 family protein n=1 Tax=Gellertiella hungarica TaxID=1572859 RepID=A0A7W6NN98_9HYPH|nr:hypothetical protein [Gellertiella hungarica]MBB4067162.1 hypothetical protein [Gellertiella hungarica]
MQYSRIIEQFIQKKSERIKKDRAEFSDLYALASELNKTPDLRQKTYGDCGLEELLQELEAMVAALPDDDDAEPETVQQVSAHNATQAHTAQAIPESFAPSSEEGVVDEDTQQPSKLYSESPSPLATLQQIVETIRKHWKPVAIRKPRPVETFGAWEDLDSFARLHLSFRNAERQEGIAFSLNFSRRKADQLLASGDPARALSRSINRSLKQEFGYILEYAFVFEFTPDKRIHVHGCIVLPAIDEERLARLRACLKRSGGKALAGRYSGYGRGRQVDLKELYNGARWHSYSLKDWQRTVELLSTEKISFISQSLRRDTEARHRAERAKMTHGRVSRASPAPTPTLH